VLPNGVLGLGGSGVAARVIMREHHGSRSGDDCQPEHLAWMHKDGVQSANRNKVMAFDPSPGVEK